MILIDVRDKKKFAERFIKNSINIGLGPSFLQWIKTLIPNDEKISLIASSEDEISQVNEFLGDRILNSKIFTPSQEDDSLKLIRMSDFKNREKEFFIVDVREQAEWDQGHIDEAVHIPLSYLQKRQNEIPKDKNVVLICRSGYRSSIGASLLKKLGFQNISHIDGGMSLWLNTL